MPWKKAHHLSCMHLNRQSWGSGRGGCVYNAIFKKHVWWKFSKHLIRTKKCFKHCSNWTSLLEMIDFLYLGEFSNKYDFWGEKNARPLCFASNAIRIWLYYLSSPPPDDRFIISISSVISWLLFYKKKKP